jgi:NAD(P)-dependent dehydrogenase (short-subunit alcohol dehydrogenase family)
MSADTPRALVTGAAREGGISRAIVARLERPRLAAPAPGPGRDRVLVADSR